MTGIEAAHSTALYGMMGAGKTSLGMLLAERFGQPFVDTDGIVEGFSGLTCAEMVADPAIDFAAVQRKAILEYHPETPTVIATGGSVAMYPELTKHIGSFGLGVFIKVDPEVLEARLNPERILALNNPDNLSFRDLYVARMPHYEVAADKTLEVADEPLEDTLQRLVALAIGHTLAGSR